MKRIISLVLIALVPPAGVGGCDSAATTLGKATVAEPPKTHKTHSPPPVGTTRPR